MIKKNFSLDDETAELYDKVLQQKRDEKGDTYTNGAFLEDLLNSFINPRVKEIRVEL